MYNGYMKRNDHTFKEMVARIESGELTRKQASDAYGVSYGTLGVWLHRSAKTLPRADTPEKRAKEVAPRLEGDRLEALNKAAARVLAGESTAYKECQQDPSIKLSTLNVKLRRSRSARVGAGVPDRHSDTSLMYEVMRDPTRLHRAAAILRAAGV